MDRTASREGLSDADSTSRYINFVRQIFSSSSKPSDAEVKTVLPPLAGVESVQIEITTWCNLKCQQCSRTKGLERGIWKNDHLPIDKYAIILDKLPSAQRLILQGVGEPTMHPGFLELCQLAKATNKYQLISFNTNGLTHSDVFWFELSQAFNLGISLSIDSLDPVVAERCRSGTNISLLSSRLRLFGDLYPNLIITLVASKLNIDDISRTLSSIGSLGTFVVAIQGVITDDQDVALNPADEAKLRSEIAECKSTYPMLTVRWETISTGLKRCVAPFLAPFVTIDGYLTPCCALVKPEEYSWVSVIDEYDWDSIRSHENVVRWSTQYISESPMVCNGCTFNPARTNVTREAVANSRFHA